MALNRKYSALPDLDTAPDIYETPELTDDNSTVPTTTGRSHSEDEFEDEDPSSGVSRSRLQVDQARSRFLPSNVDARDVDFSDRVNGKRKSYKVTSRRQRILDDGTEELGDLSDDDDAENLARKIARLKREVEEAKAEYAKQKATSDPTSEGTAPQDTEIDSLSLALESISTLPDRHELGPRVARVPDVKPTADDLPPTADAGDSTTYTVTYAPTYQQTHALAKAADFDRRLLLLEKSLGIGSSATPELDAGGLPRALLPTLETLGKQIGTLSEASVSSLDSISRRVRALIQEAEQLEKSRKLAKAAQDALTSTGAIVAVSQSDPSLVVAPEGSEQAAKINALYGTLPTIENLAPLLPPLLDRLRSLRAIHADAASAGETLDRIERNQAELAGEIRTWREGLEKIESAMQEGDVAMTGNMKVIEGWVNGLEVKMAKLS